MYNNRFVTETQGSGARKNRGVSLQIFQVHSLSSSKLLLFTLDNVTVVLKVEEVDVLRALSAKKSTHVKDKSSLF